MPLIAFDEPRLLADIGGTSAHFTLETAPGVFEHMASLRCADHADFHAAVTAYLCGLGEHGSGRMQHAAIAIANPVEGDQVRMTHCHWQFSVEQMRQRLQFDTLVVVNDFTALAMALPRLEASQRRQVGAGAPRERSVVGLIGAGSGLGVSGLIPVGDGWVALGTEGGHASFAPRDEREIGILRYALTQSSHVSFERLLSGPGIELIHRALLHRDGRRVEPLGAPEITRRALEGSDPLCAETLQAFCAMLGTAAANLAVTLGAKGGIFIGGSIVPRLGEYFDRSPFRARFEDKGRFSDYLKAIPSYVITAEHATFVGASAILAGQLRGLQASQGSTMLGRIQRSRANLSRAERRVADRVLAHPRSALNEPIAEIARAAEVSQPTVIRFCRSLGCEGLSDFKLRLASSLGGTMPVTHVQVTDNDSMVELGAKVLGNTASAILQVRSHLNHEMIDRVIDLLIDANRIELYTLGPYGVLAQDAQFKFLRFGIPSNAYADSAMQLLAAGVLEPGDVALIISSSGREPELLEVADKARERGAAVVAITSSQSPLARKADAALIVDHVEDLSTQLPMVSRILKLLIIDILVVGIAMRRSPERAVATGLLADAGFGPAALGSASVAAEPDEVAAGVSSAPQLARMTLHSR